MVRVVGAGEFAETYPAMDPLGQHPESPSEVAWTEDGTLVFAQQHRFGRVDPDGVTEFGPYDCGFDSTQTRSFEVVGGFVLMGATGYFSHGEGVTDHCTAVIEAIADPEDEPWTVGTTRLSADGDRRVLSCRQRDGEGTVASLDDTVSGERLWELSSGVCPTLAPGSGRIAFHDDGRMVVGAANEPSSWSWFVQGAGHSLTWSPDGQFLLFQRDSQEWAVVSAATGQLVGSFPSSHARWSSSSAFLLAQRDCDAGERLVEVVANAPGLPVSWSSRCGLWVAPSLSPDGQFLAATEWVGDESRMYVVAKSGQEWRFDGAQAPAWRPAD